MRVFVLCTGRSGSVTFIKACKHIKNYSSGHETLSKALGSKRLNYPDNHIEADNRLSWFLGSLDKKFGAKPIYVHLVRNKEDTILSFKKRWNSPGGIIKAFYEGILKTPQVKSNPKIIHQICEDYLTTVTDNINLFLKDKETVIKISLENIQEDFSKFWVQINAEGNLEDAVQEFNKKYNSSNNKKNYLYRLKLFLLKFFKPFNRI